MKYLFIIILFFLSFQLYSQIREKDCSEFKLGRFTYPLPPKVEGYEIRSSTQQLSFKEGGIKHLLWEIQWNNECQYTLTLKEIYGKKDFWSIGDIIDAEIISINKNCYRYKSTLKAKKLPLDETIEDEMCKEEE